MITVLNETVGGILERMIASWGSSPSRPRDTMSAIELLQAGTCDAAILDASLTANPAVVQALVAAGKPLVLINPMGAAPLEASIGPAEKRTINSPIKPELLQRALIDVLEQRPSNAARTDRPENKVTTERNLANVCRSKSW
jgi:hypothetical protein